jgi:ATP-dependent helicase/nuclease subunit A
VTAADSRRDTGDDSTLYRFRRNLVVVASAGTGKTHALVGVLIHLALGACEDDHGGLVEPVPLARIVATTFSRKAAAEIKDRLTRELTRLATLDAAAAYRQDLGLACDRVGRPRFTDLELAARASRALDALADARIGTLHGLATALVRAKGPTLTGSDIEDEDDARERAREAASQALEELLHEDAPAASSLAHLAGGVGPLIERGGELLGLLSEDGRRATDLTLSHDDARAIEKRLDEFLEHVRGLCQDPTLGPLASALAGAWEEGSPPLLEEAAARLCACAARGKLSEEARAFFEFRGALPGITHGERGRNLVRLWKMRHAIVAQAELMKTFLVRAEARLLESMGRDSVLSYGEVLRTCRDVLQDAGVARELGASRVGFLIDELQDTSHVQREIVELLWQSPDSVDPRLPRLARIRRRGLLVVGDRKQSIYGFRGADVGSFAELCIGLAGRAARDALRIAPGRVWEPEEPIADFVALRHNRRSAPEILEFVNAYSKARLVASAEPPELYEIEYAPAIEDLSPPADADWAAPSPWARVSWIRVPPERGPTSSRASEAEALARRIGRILADGKPCVRGLPPSPKDIAVLALRNGMLEGAAYALARAGIPYVVAGNGFFSAREVKDVVAMLSFIVDPRDSLARAAVVRGPFCAASDDTLVALTDPDAGLADCEGWGQGERRQHVRPEDTPRLEALRDVVLRLRGVADALGPAETLRLAVRELALEETLLSLPRGEQRVANVRKVIALAEREPNGRAFLARMARATDEERAEPEAATFSETEDAVRLLTVHASKGLDFPIVLLPEAGAVVGAIERSPIALVLGSGTGQGTAPRLAIRLRDDDGRLHDTPSFADARRDRTRRELAERARLAYVAATRAREAVVFIGDRRIPKGARTDVQRSAAAVTLAQMALDEVTAELFRVEGPDDPIAAPLPREDRAPEAFCPLTTPHYESPSPTAAELDDFAVCPRRFELKHLLRLPEPRDRAPLRQLSLIDVAHETTRGAALVEARWSGAFARAPIATCRSIGCGYVGLCHPQRETSRG